MSSKKIYEPSEDFLQFHSSPCTFFQVTGIAFKNFHSNCSLLLMIYIGLASLNEIVVYYMGLLSSIYLSIVIDNSAYPKTLDLIITVSIAIGVIALLSSSQELVLKNLTARSRKNLTSSLQRCYMSQTHFHHVNRIGTDYHHDQVITQDADKVCHYLSEWLSSVVVPFVVLGFYIVKTSTTFGIVNTAFLSSYFVFFVGVMGVVSMPLKRSIYQLQQEEGGLRKNHSALREHTDSHHASKGLDVQLHIISANLKKVVNHMKSISFYSMMVEFCTTWFRYSCPILLIICYRHGASMEKEYGSLSRYKIYQSTIGLFFAQKLIMAFTTIIDSTKTYIHLKAHICRVSKLLELYRYLDGYPNVKKNPESGTSSLCNGALSYKSLIKWDPADLIVVSNLSLFLPDNNDFHGNVFNFTVKKFYSLGITGPNGCGKSTLIRFINGLLRPTYGTVNKNNELEQPQTMLTFFSYQHYPIPYTIYDQLVYPCFYVKQQSNFYTKANFCLLRVGLKNYCCDSSSNKLTTHLKLSTGEQQRLMFAKILFFKPILAIIDEWIYSLPREDCMQMFNICMEEGVTFVTASQDVEILKQTHHRILEIGINDSTLEYYNDA